MQGAYGNTLRRAARAIIVRTELEKSPMPSHYVIGEHLAGFIRSQLDSGRYASASEVIREALRLLEEQEALRQLHVEQIKRQIQGPGQ